MSNPPIETGKVYRVDETYGKVPSGLFLDTTISHGAIRLYAYLHWRYGKNQQAFPHQGTIAHDLGVSEKTISTWALELELADWLIVLHRTNKDTGKRISNKYHVFEVQAECVAKREAWKVVKPQPKEAPGRKSRKGIGGPRKSSEETTRTQVPMDHQNSSSDGLRETHQNSSSDKPDSLLKPDSPMGAECATVDESLVLFRTIQSELVTLTFGGNARQFGNAGDLAHVVMGDATKPQYNEWNVDPGVTGLEWEAIKLSYADKKDRNGEALKWPRRPGALNQMVHEFRTGKDRAKYMKRAIELMAPPEPPQPTAQEIAMAAALQAVEQAAA